MKKCLVIESSTTNEIHGYWVRTYFMLTNPTWQCDVAYLVGTGAPSGYVVYNGGSIGGPVGMSGVVQFAIENGYDMISRSYQSFMIFKLQWDIAFAAGIQVVHAHFSNDHVENNDAPYLIQSVITVAGGVTENIRSWGNGLEFFDSVPLTYPFLHPDWNENTVESFATPIVAAKIALIMDGCPTESIQEIRYRAQRTASQADNWTPHDGFGIIDVDAAIAFEKRRIPNIVKTPLIAA
jgi:hypothetical protein